MAFVAFSATSAFANVSTFRQEMNISADKNVNDVLMHRDEHLATVENESIGQDPLQVLWNEIKKNHSTITVDTDDMDHGTQRFELHDPVRAETNNKTGRFDDVKLPQYHSDDPDDSYDPDDEDVSSSSTDTQSTGCDPDCAYVKNNADPDNYPLNHQPLGIYGSDTNIHTDIGTLPAKDSTNSNKNKNPHLKGVVITLNHNLDLGFNGSVAIGKSKIQNGRLTVGETEIQDGSVSVSVDGPKITKQGIDSANKKITHVADGIISPTSQDAVTGRQLYHFRQLINRPVMPDLTQVNLRIAHTDYQLGYLNREMVHLNQRIKYLNQKVDAYDKRAERGIATAMAMSGLPQPTMAGDSMMAVAGSEYHGHSSIAIGYSEVSDNDKEVLKFDTATNLDGKSDIAATIGYGYQW
ncbi:YadA family autotransporter adhesin [Actinobacillus delphinicola]|uniref:YadA domain-containing protein n=1 Tax=Actinobacillus delphinicola TaxID=51161 RepID=A0A448TSD8_9PAST|nr:YadA-like family protein [Actinobacillus delphinicola]VEJ08743.1 YadA domain-containing protein [Actinobacillus delphinicola]